jgi:hypothetical protein
VDHGFGRTQSGASDLAADERALTRMRLEKFRVIRVLPRLLVTISPVENLILMHH